MHRSIPFFVLLYGLLVASGGTIGWLVKGSIMSVATGGTIGVLLVACGVGMLRKSDFAARAALWLILATVAVMAERLIRTGGIIPAVPVIAAGLGLSYVLYVERAMAAIDAAARGVPKERPPT